MSHIVKQKAIGILMLIACVAYIALAATGKTAEERDVSALLFILPMAIGCLFSKHPIIE